MLNIGAASNTGHQERSQAFLTMHINIMSSQPTKREFLKYVALTGLTGAVSPFTALAAEGRVADGIPQGLAFLFQGDSITDGGRGRTADPNHVMGHGYAFAAASRIGADFPEAKFSFYNRGVSGNKVPDLQKRWQSDTIDINPDVLSILIGINDTSGEVHKTPGAATVEEFEQGYRKLLQDSRATKPKMLLVLGLPFAYPVGTRKDNWEAWRDGARQRAEVVRKLAAEFDAVLVDYPSVFDKAARLAPIDYWVWDGIHPTVFGHELMAREWIKQVGKRLPFLRQKYQY